MWLFVDEKKIHCCSLDRAHTLIARNRGQQMVIYPSMDDVYKINPLHGKRDESTKECFQREREAWMMDSVSWGTTTNIISLGLHNISCPDRDKRMDLFLKKFVNPGIHRGCYFGGLLHQKKQSDKARENHWKKTSTRFDKECTKLSFCSPIYEGYEYPLMYIDSNTRILQAVEEALIKPADVIWITKPWPRILQDIIPHHMGQIMTDDLRKELGLDSTNDDKWYYPRSIRDRYYKQVWNHIESVNKQSSLTRQYLPTIREFVLWDQSVKENVFKPQMAVAWEPYSVPKDKDYQEQFSQITKGIFLRSPHTFTIIYLPFKISAPQPYIQDRFCSAELSMMRVLKWIKGALN